MKNVKLTKLQKKRPRKPKKLSVNLKKSSEKGLAPHLPHLRTTVEIGQGGMMSLTDIKKKRGNDLGQGMIKGQDTVRVIKELNINQVIVIMKRGDAREVEIIIDTKIINIGGDLRVKRGEGKEASRVAHHRLHCILIEIL